MDPFERSNPDLNQLKIEDSHLSTAHSLEHVIHSKAQVHLVSAGVQLRKTSTPAELEILGTSMAARVQKMVSFVNFTHGNHPLF